ncbi:MAG: TrkA family potassium uptake protein [bacterium]|nr:TrkA family potassium uptake protein [bacterium]
MPATRLVSPGGRNRRTRAARRFRALWRYTSALWNEFYVPIVGFAVVLVAGGVLYGHLFYAARGETLAFNQLPYMMLALMLFQGIPEHPVPSEPELVAFWYVLPILGIILIGRGAADFVRLFFNVGENQSAWEEAVASTYRNHVIVIGANGHVGLRVTRQLVGLGYEVVGIDQRNVPERLSELTRLSVPMISGDGRLPATLESAGIQHASAIVITTSNDQVNFEIAMRARAVNEHVRIVVRQWDTQFADQLKQMLGVQAVFSVSDIAAPVFAGAAAGLEIAPSLHIGSKDYSMVRIVVQPNTPLIGQTIGKLQTAYDMDIVLHECNGEITVQPHRETILQSGDTIVVFALHSTVQEISARARQPG